MAKSKATIPHYPPSYADPMVNEPQATYGASLPLAQARFLGQRYDMAIRDLADVLEVTPKTFHRWSLAGDTLSPQQSDRISILTSLFGLGERVFASHKVFTAWLREPVLGLGGKTPLETVKTESGRRAVENVLHQIEFGIY